MQFVFSQLDSWCFREARPMGAIGGTAIETLFPPPGSTLIGACRSLIGDSQGIDWQAFADNKLPDKSALLGNGEHTGALQFEYPFLRLKKDGHYQRLYPVPATLLIAGSDILALQLDNKTVECDLGKVKLPVLADSSNKTQTIENCWLTEQGLHLLLCGKLPTAEHFIDVNQLMQREVRLGIARDNKTAVVQTGALYQTEHVRLKEHSNFEQIDLVVPVSGIPELECTTLAQQTWQVRLGGEGRLAHVVFENEQQPEPATVKAGSTGLLYLTSPADLGSWLPAEFTQIQQNGVTLWQGQLQDVTVTIEAFCAGKALKLGGWDSALRRPKAVKSLVPAGACYFVQCEEPEKLINLLKSYRFGEQTGFGLGSCLYLPQINA